jgi:hypothetical protein
MKSLIKGYGREKRLSDSGIGGCVGRYGKRIYSLSFRESNSVLSAVQHID